jgi:hypothetical protein
MKPHDGYFEVVWPRSERQMTMSPLAGRLETLAGKRVAQLWDHVFRGDEIFEQLEGELQQRFPGVGFVSWREFGNTHGDQERQILESLPQRLRALGVDAVISGMGC